MAVSLGPLTLRAESMPVGALAALSALMGGGLNTVRQHGTRAETAEVRRAETSGLACCLTVRVSSWFPCVSRAWRTNAHQPSSSADSLIARIRRERPRRRSFSSTLNPETISVPPGRSSRARSLAWRSSSVPVRFAVTMSAGARFDAVKSSTCASTMSPTSFAAMFSRAFSTASGSMSIAATYAAPSFAAVIASTPEPVPTSIIV